MGYKNIFTVLLLFSCVVLSAQTGIGTTTPNASAKLDVYSTNKGFLPPRVTLTSATDATTIAAPAEGLLVYNLGSSGLQAGYYYWNNANWATIATATSAGNGVTSSDLVKLYGEAHSSAAGKISSSTGYVFTVPVSGRYLFDFTSGATTLSGGINTIYFQVRQGTTVLASDTQSSYNNNVHVEYNGKLEVNLQAGVSYNIYNYATSGSFEANDYDRVYYKMVAGNLPINQYTLGDIKTGMQANDHNGWIRLNGRLKSTLSASQQAQANLLGIGANLPNADNSVLMQSSSGTFGIVNGSNSKTIIQANLPNYNLPAATTSSNGDHTHWISAATIDNRDFDGTPNNFQQFGLVSDAGSYSIYDANRSQGRNTLNAGTHNHNVTVSSGGSGTALDVTPQYLKINTFIYLGF